MTTLYSYIVAYDGGSAPNPFHGFCTLAICKPGIRKTAQKCDYVIGLAGSKYRKNASVAHRVVYAMQITEEPVAFAEYWENPRFHIKRPNMKAGEVERVGDNIYHRGSSGKWVQEKSVHDSRDKKIDLSGKNVLISENFIYWGADAPLLCSDLRTLIVGRNYKRFRSYVDGERQAVEDFIKWFESKRANGLKGCLGTPFEWEHASEVPSLRTPVRRSRKKC